MKTVVWVDERYDSHDSNPHLTVGCWWFDTALYHLKAETAKVDFEIECETQFGDSLKICGDSEPLGGCARRAFAHLLVI
jgi:hypothetical protein